MSEIEPALTEDVLEHIGWWFEGRVPKDTSEAVWEGPPDLQPDGIVPLYGPHVAAAMLLYGQPFGFTWEDVDLIDDQATLRGFMAMDADWEDGPDRRKQAALHDLADRIAALLPPRHGG